MKLFVDNNLSPYLARSMHQIVSVNGDIVVALRDKFSPGTSDLEWIQELGNERGWAVLTDDHRIRKNPAEREAWRSTDLLGFFLAPGWRKQNPIVQTGRLLLQWERFQQAVTMLAPGSIVEVPLGLHSKLRPFKL